MKATTLLSALLVGVLATTASAEPDQKLEGVWVVESFEADGQQVKMFNGSTFEFDGEKLTIKMGEMEVAGTFKVDLTKDPKQLDIEMKSPDGEDSGSEAIYKLEGDTLTICTSVNVSESSASSDGEKSEPVTTRGERPTKFDSEQGALIVLKRKKE